MLEFIRKKRSAQKPQTYPTEAKKVKFLPETTFKTDLGTEVQIPIEKVEENWVNFENVEPEKLEWMQDIKLRDIQGEVKLRVDFEGEVVNPLAEISWREGLHHHGEDEQLPGYTLQEMIRNFTFFFEIFIRV